MHHQKRKPLQFEAEGANPSGELSPESNANFTADQFFMLAARATLIGCTLHRIELEHRTLFRLECCTKGATILSHGHDLSAALTARGRA